MKVGLVTYQIAQGWDLGTLLRTCVDHGFAGVELRTSHAHGVEPSLGSEERALVRSEFEKSGVRLWGLGTTCEFHSPDPDVLARNIETARQFIDLARDTGAVGIKVRPNAVPEGVPVHETLSQIGKALRRLADHADQNEIEIWLEVHGKETSHVPHVREIMEVADSNAVGVCWNSNPSDIKDGSIGENFELIKKWIRSVHVRDLSITSYPWQDLINRLYTMGYDRFVLAEIPDNPDHDRILSYFSALWGAQLQIVSSGSMPSSDS